MINYLEVYYAFTDHITRIAEEISVNFGLDINKIRQLARLQLLSQNLAP